MSKKHRSADADAMKKDRDGLESMVVDQLKFYDKLRSLGDSYKGANPQEMGMAMAREAPGIISDLVRSSLEMQSSLLQRSERHYDNISQSLFGDKAKAASGSTVRLSMEAVPGKACEAPFRLKNPRDETMEITFSLPVLKLDGVAVASAVGFLRKDGGSESDFQLPEKGKDGKGSAKFCAVVTLPPDAKAGCYEGTAHVVTDSLVLGHVEFVINVKSVESDHIEAAVGGAEAKSEQSWETTNSHPEARSLAVASQLRLQGDDGGLVVQLRIASTADGTTVFEIDGKATATTCLAIAPQAGHPWRPGVFRAVVPIFLGADLASERSVVVTIQAGEA